MANNQPLLIPIENQVRELDPKLLLAVCAANAGIKSYVGYRTEMDIIISKFPICAHADFFPIGLILPRPGAFAIGVRVLRRGLRVWLRPRAQEHRA